MKRKPVTNELYKINMLITVLTVIGNILIFFCIDTNSVNYTILNIYYSISVLFVYFYILITKTKRQLLDLKNEIMYINYPLNIFLFFAFLCFLLIASMLCLFIVNKDAANVTSVFTFFLTTISVLMPSIILCVIVYFISPALIIPNLKTEKNKKKFYLNLYLLLFSIYIGICLINGFSLYSIQSNLDSQNRFKSSKLTIRFATESLKIGNDVRPYAKKLMSADKFEVPFFYTSNSFQFANYKDAETFCKVIDARVPNYLETFHIAFNYFDTFGDKYYWTADKDGDIPLVLHFKNMSYTIERLPKNVKPILHCVSSAEENYGFKNKDYFYRNSTIEREETEKSLLTRRNGLQDLDNLLNQELNRNETNNYNNRDSAINREKKHVNFSVRVVSNEIMEQLKQQGYEYDSSVKIKKEYEVNDAQVSQIIGHNLKNIRLCYFPFTNYTDMDINQERQLWQQSFCSPAFTLINSQPGFVSGSNKNAFCSNYGGRLPNLPELAAILKNTGADTVGAKFWTNSYIIDSSTKIYLPVFAYYNDSRFMNVEGARQDISANVYCIKPAMQRSYIISNYKSKFQGYDGKPYAQRYCPECHYYEVPDTVLNQ